MQNLDGNRLTQADIQQVINRINEKGWLQDSSGTEFGPNCLIGHIIFAFNGKDSVKCQSLRRQVQNKVGLVSVWNDTLGRTKEQVIELLSQIRDEYE